MSGLTFGHPEFFLALFLLLPLAILRVRAHFKGSRNLPGLVSPRLHKQLIVNSARATAWATFALQCLAMASVITALARPQLGFDEIDSQTEGRNLIIAIDTSRSMLADDLRPNRLTRAKLAAKDIILALPEDRVGLLAFAGRPFIQAPLTVDHEAVIESIDQLDTEIIPRGGTNIAEAARLAMETFNESEVEQSALVIFSDGEALEGSEEIEEVRRLAKEAGMTILSVGVGTLDGAIIPEINAKGQAIPGLFIMDDNGQVVKSRLEPLALQELASLGGTYIHLGGQASLTEVAKQIREGIATSREDSETRLRPIERFMWPLGASILFLVLAYLVPIILGRRRNVPATARKQVAAAVLTLLLSSGLNATEGFENGYKAFEAGDYQTALELYEGALAEKITDKDRSRLQMGVGATAYKLGDFERAAAAYGEALTHRNRSLREQAHYNLGNTLYQRGEAALQAIGQPANPDQPQSLSSSSESLDATIQQWESAIEHFESTLSLNDGNAQATHNMEVVKKKLEELKQQQKEQEEQEKEEEQKEEEQENEEEDKEDEEQEDEEEEQENEDQEEESDGEKEEDPDGKPEDEEGDGEPEDQPGEDEKKPEDEKEEEPGDEEDKEKDKDKDGEGDEKEDSPPEKPEGTEPEQPDAPKDGDLEADPNQEQPPAEPKNPSQPDPAELQTNPETGYSPSEARQLLDTLADETEVRPILMPSRNEVYKNW
ncbi:VWA domain-containing protein [Verrucomicrobiales bacterium]|nr:VWA domain-containing protein [Verrucomicrobiales bacterium]